MRVLLSVRAASFGLRTSQFIVSSQLAALAHFFSDTTPHDEKAQITLNSTPNQVSSRDRGPILGQSSFLASRHVSVT